jgi:membrane-bound metal-dependent hydrolase YbcI (DUF457 family)
VGTLTLATNLIGAPAGPRYVATCGLLAAGAALAPDLDQRSSTISHSLTPITEGVSTAVGAISGGHRKGTHGVLGTVIFAALVFTVCRQSWVITLPWGAFNGTLGATILLAGSLAMRALKFEFGPIAGWAGALALALLMGTLVPSTGSWVAYSLIVGYVVHLVGDALTTEMLQPFLPFSGIKIGLPLLGDAGSRREKILMSLLTAFGFTVICLAAAGSH